MSPVDMGLKVAEMIVKKVAKSAIYKRSRAGRRLGGSSGLRQVAEAGGVKTLIKNGLAKLKNEGVKKVALDVLQMVSRGVVDRHPCGFVIEFRPDCRCHIVQRDAAGRPGDTFLRQELKREPAESFDLERNR